MSSLLRLREGLHRPNWAQSKTSLLHLHRELVLSWSSYWLGAQTRRRRDFR